MIAVRSKAMNKIVREHYPVEKLPEDLRAELVGQSTVTVTIEADESSAASSTQAVIESARALVRSGRIKRVTSTEAVERIRKLRDEWPS